LRVADFDYCLPAEAIAQSPIEPRDASKLMLLEPRKQSVAHHVFRDLPRLLRPRDVLVINNTRVTARRLRNSSRNMEVLLLRDVGDGVFECLAKPAKRFRTGEKVEFEDGVTGEVVGATPFGGRLMRISGHADWQRVGQIPLPPYFHGNLSDESRYQTVFGTTPGSAAAPTAGLHFTHALLEELASVGVEFAQITLDVSIDTFRPVRSETAEEHAMHGERFEITADAASKINNAKGRVIAVGTTAARSLESAAKGRKRVEPTVGKTKLFITPGYQFQVLDGLITNFHMPRTTMLMMVAALCGTELLMRAYEEALSCGYRFLSFGDAMMILEETE
jgi:S-adenosylmethionine:tRNA ribosyltransferase-isomerase